MMQRIRFSILPRRLHTRGVSATSFNTEYVRGKRKMDYGDEKLTEMAEAGNAGIAKCSEPLLNVPRAPSRWFGVNLFGGTHDIDHGTQLPSLRERIQPPANHNMRFSKFNGIAAGMGPEFYFKDDRKHQLSYFHLQTGKRDVCFVGSTDPQEHHTKTIESHVNNLQHGHAVQLLFQGRGVKAYFEPSFPNLKARLGVGAKATDLLEECQLDPDVSIHVSKKGDLLTVHGPTEARVGGVAYRIFRKCKANVYTLKGAHIAFHPIKQKKPKGAKKK